MALDIACADGIDYNDIDAVCGYRLLLCKVFERAGGFEIPAVTNASIREVQRQGELWLGKVKSLIADILSATIERQSASGMTLAAIPALLDSYDSLYRVCTGSPCFDYMRDVKLKVADRWLSGDKTISETDVVLLLLSEADRDIRSLDRRFYTYAISVMGEWIDELTRYGRFVGIPLTEAYKRLTYLLKRDLFAYLGSNVRSKIKAQWIKEYELTDDRLDRLDTKDLWSYISFAATVAYLSDSEFDGYTARYVHLLTKLASRPDIHPYYRRGIEIDLAQYQTA